MPKIELQSLKLDNRYAALKKITGAEFSKIKKFINLAKKGQLNEGVDITEKTERKYIDAFLMCYKAVQKPLSKLTKKDLQSLKDNLKEGKIKSRFNKPYSPLSQRDMKFILIRFLEWIDPKYAKYKKWFIIRVKKKSVVYLKEHEIEKLYNSCKTAENRFLIAVLFCSGMRASEFINTRFEDWEEPTQSFPYYKVLIREEYSKTKERNIGLYWKHCTEVIREYFSTLDKSNPKAQVYPKNYDAIRLFLTRLGKRVLDKRVHCHIFRKSSASFYAQKLKSRQQLCYRYGWNFSSDVPDIYISREMGEEEVKDTIVNSSMEVLEKENRELKVKVNLIAEQMTSIQDKILEEYNPLLKKRGLIIKKK